MKVILCMRTRFLKLKGKNNMKEHMIEVNMHQLTLPFFSLEAIKSE